MKSSDGFDARRLRPPRERRGWGLRLVITLGAIFAILGVLLALAGTASLLGHGQALGSLGTGRDGAIVMLVVGVVLLWLGIFICRRCRRRLRRPDGLSMSPHLLRKRR
ncbi:hypothetical protein DN820_04690 [Stutzerimonas nosocomialis]|uniref:Uncharacterized protein n=1 Tax=Stutzerimonas nosocomialis TaxID=1056496 RepID=A0A5R9QHL4_9GAMM|nr:hypothetical protein [Stutzerimonas nosocomialis]TLX64726.1 hypothetical protein DN820_04690 [Stutzerimonas nosocomialis]